MKTCILLRLKITGDRMIRIANENLRKTIRVVVPFLLFPLAVALGVFVFPENSYAWVTVVCLIFAMLLFYASFDKKVVGTRRMVIIAVMTALSVMSRAVFSMIPALKPITSIVIITAIWIGPESGFLVGSLTAVISNFQFGQGPWTPFQMFSWGLIGAIAGLPLMSRLLRKRIPLLIYGVFAGFAYSLIMDIWTAISLDGFLDLKRYLIVVGTALPFTMTYVVANVIFLMLAFKPIGEKLERIRIKHGIF